MKAREKELVWLHGEIKSPPFSTQARVEAGVLLRRLQKGEVLSLPHARPMASIAGGCHELRIRDREVVWRIFYFVDSDAVVLLEVTDKKTRKTPHRVLENCRQRLQRYKAAG